MPNPPEPWIVKPDAPPPLHGLVLLGGQSSRMGREKALVIYHDRPQGLLAFERLSAVCERVFLSCRAEQLGEPAFEETFRAMPLILDSYGDIGPLAGLLSAMETYPQVTWLTLACDMPLVDDVVLHALLSRRDPAKWATVFKSAAPNSDKPAFEPLCAIYEPVCLPAFHAAVWEGRTGLQALLAGFEQKGRLAVISPEEALQGGQAALQGANTPDEARRFLLP